MSKRDYKVATTDGIELEPLGGEKCDKDKDKDKEKQTNGVTFGGESSGGRQTRTGVAVCSQRRALLVAGIVLGSLLLTAIIIAYAGPQNGRFAPCPMTHAPSVPCPKGGAILTPLRSFLFTSFSRDFFRPCF